MGFLDRFRSRSHQSADEMPPRRTTDIDGLPRFAVLDVETTGLRPAAHRIAEIAVVTTDAHGRVLDEWATRLNPQGPVGATEIHGITQADVADAPLFADVLVPLNRRLAGAAVVAHNAPFDLAFLRAEYRRLGWVLPHVPALCTLDASQYHLPHLDRRRLADCCWAVGTRVSGAHSALGDATATASLLAAFMHPNWGPSPLAEHVALPEQASRLRWPAGPTLEPQETLSDTAVQGQSTRARASLRDQASAEAKALVELIDRFSLADALDEGAPDGSVTYLEKLAEVLEDGEITDDEAADLKGVAEAVGLAEADVASANQAFVLALAHEALDDGKVTRAERNELLHIAGLLDVGPKVVPALLDHAEQARHNRLSAGLGPLPDDWQHGEPLRVGDKVVFTGCERHDRVGLEGRSEELGVRVLGNVSTKTTLLVSDGTMDGGKAQKARQLDVRTVHPDEYRVLLDHLQPSRPKTAEPRPAPS
ncbi:3'-5' exonuclease [Haloactinopolyspora alba]|nr:3'-5' exonuclease [Haloactinopolyspora alba]